MTKQSWQDIVAKTQQYRDASLSRIQPPVPSIPADLPSNVTALPRQILTREEVEITETSPENLLSALVSSNLSSVTVVSAFLRRAGLAQRLVNCVTEIMPEQALERARYLDHYLAVYKKPIGPLHGLPISLKEHHALKDLTCNCGFVAWHDHVGKKDSHAVQLLLKAGAVLYVRTTEPQTLMHLETSSNLYGVTVNPYNSALTCGGSSGGEGALIGLRGSCLGVGSDIGGSIRAPAGLNGIWGFRPSTYRLPLYGVEAAMKGYDSIMPVIGPMAASFEGLNVFMKALIDQKPWKEDPSLIPLPWTYPPTNSYLIKDDGQRRLRVAFLWHDGVVRPHPPVTRALRDLSEKLKSAPDIKVCDWKPYKHDHASDVIVSLYLPDGGAEVREVLAGSEEPVRPLSAFILGQPTVKEYTVPELWALNQQRDTYRAEYAALWNSTAAEDEQGDAVDVIISPVTPGAAPPLDKSRYWAYTTQWNLLDYPAMTFPYTRVDQELDKLTEEGTSYTPISTHDAACWNLWKDRGGAAGFRDAPISLQIIGRRYEDEKVFEAMQWIKSVAQI